MRILLFFILLLTLESRAGAQFLEFGGGLGATSYAGDLSRGYKPLKSRFSISGVYRMNFSEFVSFRTRLIYGSLVGNDNSPIDPLGEVRNASFKANFLEFSGAFEYYFLDFRDEKSHIRWSPYFFAGFGLSRFGGDVLNNENFSRIQAVIPFGIGVKQLIGKQFAVNFEIGPRTMFTDYLDGISGGEPTVKDFQFGHPSSNDWYFQAGLSVTYILYKIPCPFPYIPNRAMLRR